jgi:hypothetical protein
MQTACYHFATELGSTEENGPALRENLQTTVQSGHLDIEQNVTRRQSANFEIAILMHVLAKRRSGFVRHRSRDKSWVETWVGV